MNIKQIIGSCLPRRQYSKTWKKHNQYVSHKWTDYLEHYDEQIVKHITRPVDFLEIGVQNGGDLQVWTKVLPKGSTVLGIDVDKKCKDLGLPVLVGNGSDPEWLNNALGSREFDIIIDDGSHVVHEVVRSLDLLWPRVRPGGWLVIEDLHTSYWPSYGGEFKAEGASMEVIKDWIDSVNHQHHSSIADRSLRTAFFADSLCILRKQGQQPLNTPCKTGKICRVWQD